MAFYKLLAMLMAQLKKKEPGPGPEPQGAIITFNTSESSYIESVSPNPKELEELTPETVLEFDITFFEDIPQEELEAQAWEIYPVAIVDGRQTRAIMGDFEAVVDIQNHKLTISGLENWDNSMAIFITDQMVVDLGSSGGDDFDDSIPTTIIGNREWTRYDLNIIDGAFYCGPLKIMDLPDPNDEDLSYSDYLLVYNKDSYGPRDARYSSYLKHTGDPHCIWTYAYIIKTLMGRVLPGGWRIPTVSDIEALYRDAFGMSWSNASNRHVMDYYTYNSKTKKWEQININGGRTSGGNPYCDLDFPAVGDYEANHDTGRDLVDKRYRYGHGGVEPHCKDRTHLSLGRWIGTRGGWSYVGSRWIVGGEAKIVPLWVESSSDPANYDASTFVYDKTYDENLPPDGDYTEATFSYLINLAGLTKESQQYEIWRYDVDPMNPQIYPYNEIHNNVDPLSGRLTVDELLPPVSEGNPTRKGYKSVFGTWDVRAYGTSGSITLVTNLYERKYADDGTTDMGSVGEMEINPPDGFENPHNINGAIFKIRLVRDAAL